MKIARHSKIIELVDQYDIETQEELASRLNEAGFRVTQATVSRDIRELNLTKVAKPQGGSKYTVMAAKETPDGEKYIRVLREAFVSMDAAQNILVIKTGVGMANAAASSSGPYELAGSSRQHCRRRYHCLLQQEPGRDPATFKQDQENFKSIEKGVGQRCWCICM